MIQALIFQEYWKSLYWLSSERRLIAIFSCHLIKYIYNVSTIIELANFITLSQILQPLAFFFSLHSCQSVGCWVLNNRTFLLFFPWFAGVICLRTQPEYSSSFLKFSDLGTSFFVHCTVATRLGPLLFKGLGG